MGDKRELGGRQHRGQDQAVDVPSDQIVDHAALDGPVVQRVADQKCVAACGGLDVIRSKWDWAGCSRGCLRRQSWASARAIYRGR